jgi:hypothetical protein
MSRRSRKNNRAVETEDPVVCALNYVAKIAPFSHSWRSPEEIGRIIGHVFDIPRGKKDELTPKLINRHISSDPCTGPGVDMTDGFNTTGIFRREYQFKNGAGSNIKSRYLFLCSKEETPPKPLRKWYDDIQTLTPGWDKTKRGMNETDPETYQTIRVCLLELLTNLRKTNDKNTDQRKGTNSTEKRAQGKGPASEPSPKKSKLLRTEPQRIADLLRQVLNEPNNESVQKITQSDVCALLHLTLQIIVPTVSNMVGGTMSQLDAEKVLAEYHPESDEIEEDDSAYGTESSSDDEEEEDGLEKASYYYNRTLTIGEKEFLDVPYSHEFISVSQRKRLERGAKVSAELIKRIRLRVSRDSEARKPKQYRSSDLGRRYYSAVLFQAPYLSLYTAEQIIPLVVAAFLADVGIVFDPEAAAGACPSAKTLEAMFLDGSVESMLWLQRQLEDATAVFIACDKGIRKGIGHFPKVLSWWSKKEKRVMTVCLDADGSGGSSEECAQAIWQSLKKLDGSVMLFFGQTTDSGGGGVLHSLRRELEKRSLCNNIYFVAPCTLHGMNLIFANGVKASFGEGGLECRNVMQLLHSLYDLVGRYEKGEAALMWEDVNGEQPPNKISKAVLTRWWWVNVAAQHLKDNWEAWKAMARAGLNATTASTAAGKIASTILSLMAEEKIKLDLYFIVAFSKAYFVKHMQWLQKRDERAKGHGYVSRHMPVRTYLITSELHDLSNSWESHALFKDFVQLLKEFTTNDGPADANSEGFEMTADGKFRSQSEDWTYTDIKNQCNYFFEIAKGTASKHFEKEWTGELLHFAVAGEKDTSIPFCKWLIDNQTEGLGTTCSEFHETTIDLSKMITYLSKMRTAEEVRNQGELPKFLGSVAKIAAGHDVWESAETEDLRDYAKEKVLPLASSTHRVEAMVRECSHSAATNRGETQRSHYIFQRSVLSSAINELAANDRKDRELRANASMGAGKQGSRNIRSDEAKRKHGGETENAKQIRHRTRGKRRVEIAMKLISDRYKEMQYVSKEIRKKVKQSMTSTEEQSGPVRVKLKMESFSEKKDRIRPKNKRELETGIDKTYQLTNRCPYKSTNAINHTKQLQGELQERLSPDEFAPFANGGWRKITDKMKEIDGNKKFFKPLTPYFKTTFHEEQMESQTDLVVE